jgi:hypothetical protein
MRSEVNFLNMTGYNAWVQVNWEITQVIKATPHIFYKKESLDICSCSLSILSVQKTLSRIPRPVCVFQASDRDEFYDISICASCRPAPCLIYSHILTHITHAHTYYTRRHFLELVFLPPLPTPSQPQPTVSCVCVCVYNHVVIVC